LAAELPMRDETKSSMRVAVPRNDIGKADWFRTAPVCATSLLESAGSTTEIHLESRLVGSCRNIAISLIEVQKRTAAISGYEGRVDTLINQKLRGGPHRISQTRHES
jgi:hypothetical protein